VYTEFLLDTRKDPERALKVTSDAIAWSRSADSPPPYLGETYALRARAFSEAGQCEDALRAAEQAMTLSEEIASENARRIRSQCLAKLGKKDDAKKELLDVIGDTGGSDADDKNALVALMSGSKKNVDPKELDRAVSSAIADARKRRADALIREGAQLVELTGTDRVYVEATLRSGDNKSALLFVPDSGGRRSTYTAYAQLFTLDGFTTLTLDPRGHGNSRCDSLPSFDGMPAPQRDNIAADIAGAYTYLVKTRGVDPARIAIVAAGGGCSSVERAIHEHNLAPAVVYLSPVFPDDDRDLLSAISFRPPRPAFVAASDEDMYATRSMHAFKAAVNTDAVSVKTYRNAGHGASILRDPARFLDVDTWVKKTVDQSSPDKRQ
jgi:pimeloyl-ACP methyl ester carboxylesterase